MLYLSLNLSIPTIQSDVFFVVIISSQPISSSKISLWDSTNRSNRNGPIGIYTASRRLRKKVHPFVFVLVKTRWGGLLCWIPLPWDRCYAAENTASCRFRRMRSSWEIKMWDNRRELHFRSYNIVLQRSWTISAVKLTLFLTKLYIYISFIFFHTLVYKWYLRQRRPIQKFAPDTMWRGHYRYRCTAEHIYWSCLCIPIEAVRNTLKQLSFQ